MASLADIVVYSTVGAILSVAIVTGMCAVYIALSRTQAHAQKLTCNKYVVPGFPCDGTLMMMAKDGVIYVVPEGKAVVNATRLFTKCTVVVFLEVVTGTEGSLTMNDYDDEHDAQDEEESNQNPLDHVFSDWPFTESPRSQDRTVSISTEEESALAGEMATNEGMMI